jgi:O-antigen/teichoic acid export membrane protein
VWFTPALGFLLGGYLFFSKSFAYLHVPGTPVFVGEIVLGIGLFEVLRVPSPWRHLLNRAPALRIGLAFLAVCCVRLVLDYPKYGLDAVRDASVGFYVLFAFLAAAAVVSEPTFVPRLLGWYRKVLPAFLVWAPIALMLASIDALTGIYVPGTETPVNSFKAGDFGVQIAVAIGFLWLDARRAERGQTGSFSTTITLSLIGLIGLAACLSQNRGGFIAAATVLLVVAIYLSPARRRRLVVPLIAGLAGIAMLVMLLNLRLPTDEREFSVQQVAENMLSIIQRDQSEDLSGTVEWREQYWQRIRHDMLTQGTWKSGFGFGVVLGAKYGADDPDDPAPLRSAHNTHLTVFARTGVVGLIVWALLWLAWSYRLGWWIRRRSGGVRDPDGAIVIWILAAAIGFLVNAYFDPSLEGPQACIWLYVLVGVGAAMTRRLQPDPSASLHDGNGAHRLAPGPIHWRTAAEQAAGRFDGVVGHPVPPAGASRWNFTPSSESAGRFMGIVRRLGWAVADQAFTSFTNFMVGVVVARSLGPTEFGAFSVAFATYYIAVNVSRGLATDPLLVRYSDAKVAEWRRAVASSTGLAIAVGVAGGAVCIVLGLAMSGPHGLAFVALGMTMPGMLLQDSWRFAFFAAGKAGHAFANDVLRAVGLAVLLALVLVTERSSEFWFMLAWGGSAGVAGLLGVAQARLVPRVNLAVDWLRRHRDLCSRYLAENLTFTGGTQLKFYGVAAVGGLAVVGSLRAAELLFGGVFVLTQGLGLMAVPEAVRLLRQSPSRLRQFSLLIAVLAGGGAIAYGALLPLIPDSLGQRLLNASWAPASSLILPTTVFVAAFGVQMGAWAGLRALAAASRSLRSQVVGIVVGLGGALIGAAVGDAQGAAWGIALGAIASATFWWWQFRLGLRDHRRAEERLAQAATMSDARARQ